MARDNTECLVEVKSVAESISDSGTGAGTGTSTGAGTGTGTTSTADESLTPNRRRRRNARQVVCLIAKVVGAVLAVLSGAYAVLSYYSSIAALRAAVEANRLTLLIYCESNNSTDAACDQVRKDYSSQQAVTEVFQDELKAPHNEPELAYDKMDADHDEMDVAHDEMDVAHDEMDESPAQVQPVKDKWKPESFHSQAADSTLATITVPGTTNEPASWPYTSVLVAPSPPTSAPVHDATGKVASSDGPHHGPDRTLPSDYSTWVATCTTLELRMKRVRREMETLPCPAPSEPPSDYQSLNPRPTSQLVRSCSTLVTQYYEAKRGFEFHSCPSPWDPSIYTKGLTGPENTGSLKASRPAAAATPAPGWGMGAGNGYAKMCAGPDCTLTQGRMNTLRVTGRAIAIPLGALVAFHVLRLLYADVRRRQRRKRVQSWTRQDEYPQHAKLMEDVETRV